MHRHIATIVVCIGLSSPASAVEWSLYSTLSEMVNISDNPFLSSVPRSGVGSTSNLVGNLSGRTKTSRFDLDANVNYSKYWGPAADAGGALAETNSNGVRLNYETYGKTQGDRNFIGADWRRSSTASAIFDELGFPTNVGSEIHTSSVQGGIERALTPTDFWTLSSRAASTNYVPPSGGAPFYSFGTNSSFRHESNQTATLTGSADVSWLKFTNANTIILNYVAGLEIKPIQSVRLVASGGAATVVREQSELPLSLNPAAQPSSSVASGFVGNVSLTYQFWPTTQLAVNVGQSIGPTSIGNVTQQRYASASLRHEINPMSFLLVTASASQQLIATGQTAFFGATATYSRVLARDLNLTLAYQYSHRGPTTGTANVVFDPITGLPIFLNGSNTGAATSNSLFMTLSKRFAILPNRT